MIGKTLSHYRIIEKLGQGGMGEVFLAEDTNLNRRVAVKLLPDIFAGDSERLARFEREARLLASLSHQNIASIYGLEEAGGKRFIVMERAEGQTLAQRISRGPLPLDETLEICRQIAEGLEAAHEKGIIHRDLKPANVMIAPDGKVKILDFGLAKALSGDPGAGDLAASPTISEMATRRGVIMGTAAYMSPEQARGKVLDRRTDVWSFGCLLYEMLTGRMAFQADTISDTLAHILTREPDWQTLPAQTPAHVRSVLVRCLRKDVAQRLRDIADARMELSEPPAGGPGSAAVPPPDSRLRPVWRHPLFLGLAGAAVLLSAALIWSLGRAPERPDTSTAVTRLSVLLPPGRQLVAAPRAIAISPDGGELIFWAEEDRGRPGPIDDVAQLYRRSLNSLAVTPIPGTEMGGAPFFSPDGEWLGFFGQDGLKKVSLRGGAPISVSGATTSASPTRQAGAWIDDKHVVCATGRALFRLTVDGGQAETLLTWEHLQKGEIAIAFPSALPDTSAFLVNLMGADPTRSIIAVWSDGQPQRILRGGLSPIYLPTGHLLYLRQTQSGGNHYDAYAVPFDLSRLKAGEREVPVLQDIRYGQLAVSATGTLAYNSSGAGEMMQQLTWVSRGGAGEPIGDKQAGQFFLSPRLSPDGTRLLWAAGRNNLDSRLFVRELTTGATNMVGGPSTWFAAWTPDGRRVVYNRMSPEGTVGNLFWQPADGAGSEERLTKGPRHQQPLFVTPDGGTLVFHEESPDTDYDLWQLSLHGDHTPRPLLQTKASERLATLANDRPSYMAYVSDQTGRDEIWVRPFPGGEGAQQVSTEGGTAPLWTRDGLTLFYRDPAGTRLFAVPVSWHPSPTFGAPAVISGRWVQDYTWGRQYDASPDGKRLVMLAGAATAGNEITVVQNWFKELKKLVSG